MLEPRRISSFDMPTTTINLGNGNWYYNYDIKAENIETSSQEEADMPKEQYSYIQIKLSEKPTYKKCVELLIREYVTQSQEFGLINSANKDILAGITESDNITAYKEYLNLVAEIKEKVANDLGK